MWIFLLILKWIFIILGILLGLALLFTALILCVPVRYRAAGDNHEKIQYSFKVSWLLSIVAVKKKKDSEQIVFSVFGIPIKRMGNEKTVKKTAVAWLGCLPCSSGSCCGYYFIRFLNIRR